MNAKDAAMKAIVDPEKWFPGRPGYTGPTDGVFTLLHHELLVEGSRDVTERVEFVKEGKPPHEVPTRLRHMVRIPSELLGKYAGHAYQLNYAHPSARGNTHDLISLFFQRFVFWRDTEHRARKRVLEYLALCVPDNRWDEEECTLRFPPV